MNDKTDTKPAKASSAGAHRATFARDKMKGGYLIRVEGPHSARFSGRKVPVTMKDGTTKEETLDGVIWSGKDDESGKPVTLYSFIKVKIAEDEIQF